MKDIDCGTLVTAAMRMAEMIDSGNAALIWRRASEVGGKTLDADADAFHDAIVASGRPMVAPVSRQWSEVVRRHVEAGSEQDSSPGTYVSVVFNTIFPGERDYDERISLRLDSDDVWRLAGYALR